ncbi:MAG: PQQ-dependent sugar dehydrogenase, partial [Acidimicrobiia bacterium]
MSEARTRMIISRRALAVVLSFALTMPLTSPSPTVSAIAVSPAALAAGPTLPPSFHESIVIGGLTDPTSIRFASDGRVFVAEKSGLIKVFNTIDSQSSTIFADLRTNVFNFWDRGLLGLEIDPNYPTQPYLYVLYTYDRDPNNPTQVPRWGTPGQSSDSCPTPPGPTGNGCVVTGRLSRLTASGTPPVMTGTELVLVEDWCQQYPSHSVGSLRFGPEGALYASAGDGASFLFTDYGQAGSPLNPCADAPVPVGVAQVPPSAEGGALRSQD